MELNIWERKHVEEWIRVNPEMLGEDLLILTVEFDRFVQSSDRPDLLALDRSGNLVVIDLKRDSAAGYADRQSDQIRRDGLVNDCGQATAVLRCLPEKALWRAAFRSPRQKPNCRVCWICFSARNCAGISRPPGCLSRFSLLRCRALERGCPGSRAR